MTKQSLAISLALIVAVMPFLGFPSLISDIYYTGAGLFIAVLIHLSSIHYCKGCQSKIKNGQRKTDEREVETTPEEIEEIKEIKEVEVDIEILNKEDGQSDDTSLEEKKIKGEDSEDDNSKRND